MENKKNNFYNNEFKGLFLSFLIHTSLIGAVLIYKEPPIKIASSEKKVSLDLMTYELPKQVIKEEIIKPIQKQKVVEPKKKVKTPPKKVKKIIEQKTEMKKHIMVKDNKTDFTRTIKEVQKKKKIQEEKQVSKENLQPKKVKEQLNHAKMKREELQRQIFVKTNFKIIRDMIFEYLRYPNIARRMGWQGIAKIQLIISEEGKLLHVKVLESSKKKILDEEALRAALKIKNQQLPKPKIQTSIVLPIAFLLK